MRITITQRAGELERFAPTAFDSIVGAEVPFKLEDVQVSTARVFAVAVHQDGTAVDLTLDVDPSPSFNLHDALTRSSEFRFIGGSLRVIGVRRRHDGVGLRGDQTCWRSAT